MLWKEQIAIWVTVSPCLLENYSVGKYLLLHCEFVWERSNLYCISCRRIHWNIEYDQTEVSRLRLSLLTALCKRTRLTLSCPECSTQGAVKLGCNLCVWGGLPFSPPWRSRSPRQWEGCSCSASVGCGAIAGEAWTLPPQGLLPVHGTARVLSDAATRAPVCYRTARVAHKRSPYLSTLLTYFSKKNAESFPITAKVYLK